MEKQIPPRLDDISRAVIVSTEYERAAPGDCMAYEDLVLFVSFGWFISVAVIFVMYLRIRQLVEEVRILKNTVQLSNDSLPDLDKTSSGSS